MTIKEAKQEIINTVEAYLTKDETGAPMIPPERQRPILLMGPPGIGKTAVMEQAAAECGINLVSYTITHHTRQSAIGLPFIRKQDFGGREYSVTEYTMSEIIAAVYKQIERSGIKEGILFLDEINCVSETLAPTMLQFLQYKMFGTHRVPEGFLIVTAGNPPEYNKSVRDLDIVTLDRVKRIDIEVDFSAWKEYAVKAGIHGSILSYLEIRREHFYHVRTSLDGREFVTARGWEDLSRIIQVYEKLGKPVTEMLVREYLESPEIAADYAAYYDLFNRYRNIYRIEDILKGQAGNPDENLKTAAFDEKLSLIGLLTDSLNQEFRTWSEEYDTAGKLFSLLKMFLSSEASDLSLLRRDVQRELDEMTGRGIASSDAVRLQRKLLMAVTELERAYREEGIPGQAEICDGSGEAQERPEGITGRAEIRAFVKEWFAAREERRKKAALDAGTGLTNAIGFMTDCFGEGQELVLFLTELSEGYYSLRYVSQCGNEAYYRYNSLLLLKDKREVLRAEIMDLKGDA